MSWYARHFNESGLQDETSPTHCLGFVVIAISKGFIRLMIVFIAMPNLASAETAWSTLQRFNLTGVWAVFCERPVTRLNYFETYASGPNGLARREVDRGIDIPIALSFVENVQMISPLVLKARIRNSDPNWGPLNNLFYEVSLTKEEDPSSKEISRIRFLETIRSDGKILARGGMYFDSGKPTAPTQWKYKCRTPMSAVSHNPRA